MTKPIKPKKTAYHDSVMLWKDLLLRGLEEDGWKWDWTTIGSLQSGEQIARAQVICKSKGVWAAETLVEAVSLLSAEISGGDHGRIETKIFAQNGEHLKPKTVVTEWMGPARMVLAFERPFLNLASYVSGVATMTRSFVDEIKRRKLKNPPRLTLTRKTLPGYRDIAIHGVQIGGGASHRTSLAGGVLIKENHITAAGSIERALVGVRKVAPHGMKVEVEVTSLAELERALVAGAEGVLLDNFKISQVRAALKMIEKKGTRPVVEVSGGINQKNIRDYLIEGVHVISVGALTHSVTAMDLSLLIT